MTGDGGPDEGARRDLPLLPLLDVPLIDTPRAIVKRARRAHRSRKSGGAA
jgi:hypothetical protein